MSTHVFVGPTIAPARVRTMLPEAVLHPPIRHGDALRLDLTAGNRVLIIDGLWHQSLPVRHKEILMLLAEGVEVFGAASMGALRAAELAPYGMVGIGRIFEDFRDGRLEADDEVAVLQGPDSHALTQALVDLRCAFQRAAAAGHITDDEAAALTVADQLRPILECRLPSGDRHRLAVPCSAPVPAALRPRLPSALADPRPASSRPRPRSIGSSGGSTWPSRCPPGARPRRSDRRAARVLAHPS